MAAKAKKKAKKVVTKKITVKKATKKSVAAKKPAKAAGAKAQPKKAAPVTKPSSAAKSTPAKLPKLENFLTPLDDRVVIQPDVAEEKTAGGLYIPTNAQEGPARGVVVAKGRGHRNKKGKIRPLDVNVGDKVFYSEFSGTKLTFANANVLILREEDILGIVL